MCVEKWTLKIKVLRLSSFFWILLFALTNTGSKWGNVFQLIVHVETKPSLGWKIADPSLWMRYCYEDNKEYIYM